jgi:hypothetical protein
MIPVLAPLDVRHGAKRGDVPIQFDNRPPRVARFIDVGRSSLLVVN